MGGVEEAEGMAGAEAMTGIKTPENDPSRLKIGPVFERVFLSHDPAGTAWFPRALCFTEVQRCFLLDKCQPIAGLLNFTVAYSYALQDNAIPFSDSLFISFWVLTAIVPAIWAELTELINSFDDFHYAIRLTIKDILCLLRFAIIFLASVWEIYLQEPTAEYVMRPIPKSFHWNSMYSLTLDRKLYKSYWYVYFYSEEFNSTMGRPSCTAKASCSLSACSSKSKLISSWWSK